MVQIIQVGLLVLVLKLLYLVKYNGKQQVFIEDQIKMPLQKVMVYFL